MVITFYTYLHFYLHDPHLLCVTDYLLRMGNSGNIIIFILNIFRYKMAIQHYHTETAHTLILQEGRTRYTHLSSFHKYKINKFHMQICAISCSYFMVTCVATPANMHFLSQSALIGFETEQASLHSSFTRLVLHWTTILLLCETLFNDTVTMCSTMFFLHIKMHFEMECMLLDFYKKKKRAMYMVWKGLVLSTGLILGCFLK